MSPDQLIAVIERGLAEDEQWALAASKPYPHSEGDPEVPASGVHWTWVVGENWEPVTPNLVEDEFVERDGDWGCNLATVEEWESKSYTSTEPGRMMPNTYASEIAEMDAAAAGHIARHDPARVLADVAAKRAVLAEYKSLTEDYDETSATERAYMTSIVGFLRALARPYLGWDAP